ncbi:MAG: dTDP-glucose 4,6-dehydratase [Candidatus Anammoxibacter sp.]
MKNILITGGCGFIGTNFIRYLLEESKFPGRIINVDKLTYAGNPENLKGIDKKFGEQYIFVKADICNKNDITKIFSDYQIDAVCHFAAESHVDRSIETPDAFIQTNIIGTYNLLEIARQRLSSMELFYHISTDEVYGSLGDSGFFTENSQYKPNSPYAASKASSDHLVRAYHKTYNLPIIISNCSNNYGPYQYPEKLIPLVIFNALERKPLPIYGDGKYIRDWLYVKDHCKAIWTIMKNGKHGETYNIGGNNEMENIKLVELICDILDSSDSNDEIANPKKNQPRNNQPRKELMTFVKDRPGHDRRYAIDPTKLKEELGWVPEETIESGMRKTVQWYCDNHDWVSRVKTGEYKTWIKKHYE